jgi:hypothetical protein
MPQGIPAGDPDVPMIAPAEIVSTCAGVYHRAALRTRWRRRHFPEKV